MKERQTIYGIFFFCFRTASSIDKPTDQRKRLAIQNRTLSMKPASVDHLSLSARMLLHGAQGGVGMTETDLGAISSGGSQGVSTWAVDGTANKVETNSMRVPDLTNGGKTKNTNQIATESQAERMNLIPFMTNTIGSVDKNQAIIQNDLNTRQQNGIFSLDNILHGTSGTSKELLNGGLTASKGSIQLIGVNSNAGEQNAKVTGNKVGQAIIKDGNIGEQIIHGGAFIEHAGGQMTSEGINKADKNTGKQMQTSEKIINSGTKEQMIVSSSQGGSVDNVKDQTAMLNDVMQITSGIFGTGSSNANTGSINNSFGQDRVTDNRIIGSGNIFDMTGGIVGPAPKPEKKASIIVQGARISKTASTSESVPMKAATRSGFSFSGDGATSQALQNEMERSLFGNGVIDLTKTGRQTSNVISGQPDRAQATAATIDSVFTDLTIDGSRSNVLTDKVNADSSSFIQKLASENINQTPDMNMHGSSANFGEQLLPISNTGGMTTRTGQRIASVLSNNAGVSDRQNTHSKLPLTISALQPRNGRQRIFLVRASRPQGVILSNSAKRGNMGMTISEGIQPDTGIARTSVDTASSLNGITSAGSISTRNSQLDTSAVGTDQYHADMITNNLNPLSDSGIVAGGSSFATMTASEVIDPLRTQTQRSDGVIVSETDFLPNNQETFISESKSKSTSGQRTEGGSSNILNDVNAFRNELVKSSLRQSGALVADTPAPQAEANANIDAQSSVKSTKETIDSSNAAGTSLLASNEVGGKSESSLDQTVSDLLNQAQQILSSTTTDISKAQTASKGSKSEVPVSDTSKGLHKENKPTQTTQDLPTAGLKQTADVKTNVNESPPFELSLDFLLGNSLGAKTDHSSHVGESAHIHREHGMHSSDIQTGSIDSGHSSHVGESAHTQKGHGMHASDVQGVLNSVTSTDSANVMQDKNIQASHTEQQTLNNDNQHVSLLSNLDIIGPGTGIVLPTITNNEATTNILQHQQKANTVRQAGITELGGIHDGSIAGLSISTTNDGRLGGKILDFSSNSNTERQMSTIVSPSDRQVVPNDLTVGHVTGGNDFILGHSDRGSIAQPESQRSLTTDQVMGTAGSFERVKTSQNSVVDESLSNEIGSRRIVGGNNRFVKVGRTVPNPPNPVVRDNVQIERQLNSFNLETIPGSSVVGTGVQMAGDGGMTAGFGPRDADIPRGLMAKDRRRPMSRLDGQGRTDRGIITDRRAQTSEGSFILTRDPRTGLEGRVHVGDTTHRRTENAMTGDVGHSHSSSSPSDNPVYFLDMTRGSTPGSKRIDSMAINELPQTDGSRILSDMRIIEPVDRITDSGRQGNVDIGRSTLDRRLEISDPRRADGRRVAATFDVMEGSRSATATDLRRQQEDTRGRSSGSTQALDLGFRDGTSRDGSIRSTEFDRRVGSLNVSTVRSDRVIDERIGRDRLREGSRFLTDGDRRMGTLDDMTGRTGRSRETAMGFADAVFGSESNLQTDRSFGRESSRQESGLRDRGSRLDSGRQIDGDGRIVGFNVETSAPEMSSRTGSGFRDSGSRLVSRRRGTEFDVRGGSSDAIVGSSGGFREGSSRLDTRTGGERTGSEFDARIRASDTVAGDRGRFREGSSRLDSRRRSGGTRMDVSELRFRADEGIRAGRSRLDSSGREEGDRRGSRFDTRMRDASVSSVSGSGGLVRDSSRGDRVSGMSRDGTRVSAGRGETGSRVTSRSMALGPSVVPMMRRFPSPMSSFTGPFSPMIGAPGMPFGGGFSSIDPAFGPSLGASGFLPGMGSPGMGPAGMGPGFMGPSGMGPGMGMPPPFTPMPFGGVL